MRDFLIDTQTIRFWHDTACKQHAAVLENVERLASFGASSTLQPRLLISVITRGEIEYGHRYANRPDRIAQAAFSKFVRQELPETLELSVDATEAYGEIRARLFRKYAPQEKRKSKKLPEQLIDPATARELGIQENDLWIAAQAIAHQMVLVTNDRMIHINEVARGMKPGLAIQDWTVAGSAQIVD